MSVCVSSTERLDMDHGGSKDAKKPRGLFVSYTCVGVAVVFVLSALLAVGLLSGYLGEKLPGQARNESSSVSDNIKHHATKPERNVRLPRSIKPSRYDLELKPDLKDNFGFTGSVTVTIDCLLETDNVTLHANKLDVYDVSVTTAGSNDVVPHGDVYKVDDLQFLVVPLKNKLKKGGVYSLRMRFNGTLADDLAGFYRSSYKTREDQTRWLATTQFQPTDARRAFPCFDEPDMKATFAVTIVRPQGYSSLSNMQLERTEHRPDGLYADVYYPSLKMSTYLLAFVVSDFVSQGTPRFSIWARPDAINQTEYALSIGPRVLECYEQYFHTEYPLNKTDMIALPDFEAGAMENWGLITYRETALLLDRVESSAANKLRVAIVVAHELAHQWFGNLVTMEWWDDLWLNEGFATYVEYLGVRHVEPTWGTEELFVTNELQDVMNLDCLRSSHPVSVPVSDPAEISENFDRISYGKGAAIIRMMNFFLTETVFQKGLQNYLYEMRFHNSKQDDLWRYLTEAQEGTNTINVKDVMDSWTLQIGFPVVTVFRSYDDRSALLSQKRFVIDGDNSTSTSLWKIPITYTGCNAPRWDDTETKFWLNSSTGFIAQLPESTKWFIVNIRQVGYYKVNYDQRNWQLIIDQLQKDHTGIHVINRAQIMDDIFDLARADMVNYTLALGSTQYLVRERDFTPWAAALSSFGHIDNMLRMTEAYGEWMKYVVSLLKDNYDTLTWTEDGGEPILKTFLRSRTHSWACSYGHKHCVTTAQGLFSSWKNDDSFIPPNFRSFVYCTAIKHGDFLDWEFVWQRYLNSTIASQKIMLLSALGCSREPWIMNSYLKKVITPNSGVRRQDAITVFRSVAGSATGWNIAFQFLMEHWDKIHEIFETSTFSLAGMVRAITSPINSEYQLNQFRSFTELKKDSLKAIDRTVQQALERADNNLLWMQRNFDKIHNWLLTRAP
ncbi:aminopeptidase N-like [Ornithodoros turicata]|uniref:aminopeptidase N-like n=1 Tax=Ornithodoros turicata TaxID=34597 RepID=UPI0031394AC3